MDSTTFNPVIPYLGALPNPLRPGNLIRIFGSVPHSATCFSINLQNSDNTYQRSDIALHLSPVFSPPPRIVRNSLENQHWGPEESHGVQFPLSCDQGFEILILAETDHFKIAINGQHFAEFRYRLPLEKVSYLAIDGDVIVNCIKIESSSPSPMNQGSGEEIVKPLGFVLSPGTQSNITPQTGRPASPYDMSSLPYPTNPTFGPTPGGYSPQSPASAYNPYPPASNLGPTSPSNAYPTGRVSPFSPSSGTPYGPVPGSNANPQGYPPQSGGFPSQSGGYPHQPSGYPSQPSGYPPQSGGYPSQPGGFPSQSGGYPSQAGGYPPQSGGYPSQHGGYPSQGMHPSQSTYPGQPGPYPGTHVVYPDQEKNKSGSGMNLGPLAAAGAAALAGVAGSTLMGGKHHKKNKHGHGMPGMGAGPGALLGGVSSLLGGNKHGHSGSSAMPIGGAMAGGAAALAGAYMLSKSPVGKMMKPKKMKKLYKHKHKGGWGGRSSSSSSSSSD
ncbi:basic salivary proline-rich protein 2-like [Uloborus diversus]|uniref:basic salivary proline-rich protein 2-like n=1 Tax=Uloborus diversus TaxID=327109 RepID=UPI002409D019|nr:basic salivary proline-rich protein 2-like [Uloborus diversus]